MVGIEQFSTLEIAYAGLLEEQAAAATVHGVEGASRLAHGARVLLEDVEVDDGAKTEEATTGAVAATLHHVGTAAIAGHAARVGLEDVYRDQGVVNATLHEVLGGDRAESGESGGNCNGEAHLVLKDGLVVGRGLLEVSVCSEGGDVL
jgi:hypothetical protein